MHCGSCAKKFSLMRTRKQCSECRRYYCKYCVMRKANKNLNCEICAILTSRPLNRAAILKLKTRDLQLYLANQQVSTKGCIEKEDLINLLLVHANGPDIQQPRPIEDDNSPGRHLLRNIRQFFTSSPDISGQRTEPEAEPNAGQRVHYQPVPPYFNPNIPTRLEAAPTVASSTEAIRSEQSSTPSMPRSQPSVGEFLQTPDISSSESDMRATVSNPEWSTSEQDFFRSNIPYEPFQNLTLSDIKAEQDLEDLSIHQLKGLLMRNRVDFKGCVEKAELLDRVKRLWVEYSESRRGIENFPIDDLCKICMDAPIECVMLECGHMATCTACGKQLSECPICRQYVVRVVRTFRA